MDGWPPRFAYEALPMRVVMRPGAVAEVPAETDRLGLRRVLVLSTPGRAATAERVAGALGERCVGVHTDAVAHVPAAAARTAVGTARDAGADGCVAVGGGSAIGLGKAVARELDVPVIAVPTTYAGSEMTPVWGITGEEGKRTGRDPRVLPAGVVYDPELTLDLPPGVSGVSGLNALAHAVEALYAPDASPIVSLMAAEGVRALAGALPSVVADPGSLEARGRAQYGAWLCGACLGATTMGLHHKLCHVLGGSFGLPHAATHAVLLPHVLAYNAPETPYAMDVLRGALGDDDPVRGLRALGAAVGAPAGLGALGLRRADVDAAAREAAAAPYANPRPAGAVEVRELLLAALDG
jgi:maleylacetate reductase